MPVVNYTTVNGRILHEERNGVKTLFMPDTLGNVIETRNMDTGAQTSSTTYWPYGEVRTQTGTNPSPFGFCGVWGYYTQAGQPTYVRARYYRPNLGRWQTVDPLWPWEEAFGYVSLGPTYKTDYFGLNEVPSAPITRFGCGNPWNRFIYDFCNRCQPFDYECQDRCHTLADQYYRRCKGTPGPGRFAPPRGGGEIAPRRGERPTPEAIGAPPALAPVKPLPPGGQVCEVPPNYVDPMLGLNCWNEAYENFIWKNLGADPKANHAVIANACYACCRDRGRNNPGPCLESCRIIHGMIFIGWIGDFY